MIESILTLYILYIVAALFLMALSKIGTAIVGAPLEALRMAKQKKRLEDEKKISQLHESQMKEYRLKRDERFRQYCADHMDEWQATRVEHQESRSI